MTSNDIQSLIIRKETAREMYIVLEQIYRKRKDIHVYQLMKDMFSNMGEKFVSDYYSALESKWEDLDYNTQKNECALKINLYTAIENEKYSIVFLGGLNDEFEGVKSQILNSGNVISIKKVYDKLRQRNRWGNLHQCINLKFILSMSWNSNIIRYSYFIKITAFAFNSHAYIHPNKIEKLKGDTAN